MIKVYKIVAASNDYQRLVAEDDALWKTFRFDGMPKQNWVGPKVRIFDPTKRAGDFLAFATGSLTVRDESLEAVRSSFEMAGEILQLDGSGTSFWCLNVLGSVNCVDEGASEWLTDPKTGRKITLTRPVLRRGFLSESSIFKLPQQPGSVYVWEGGNEGFYFEYHARKLTGLEFEPVELI